MLGVKALTLFQVLHASFVSIVFNQLGSSLVGQVDRGRFIFTLRNRQKYLFRNSPGPVKVTKLAKDSETHINTTSNNIQETRKSTRENNIVSQFKQHRVIYSLLYSYVFHVATFKEMKLTAGLGYKHLLETKFFFFLQRS